MPLHDRHWRAAADFIERHRSEGDRVLAPAEFDDVLSATVPYWTADAGMLTQFQWLALHKGRLDSVDPHLLTDAATRLRPVFANEVFVVLSARPDVAPLPGDDVHVTAFHQALSQSRQQRQVANDQTTGPRLLAAEEIGRVPRQVLESACRAASQAAYLGDSTAICRVLTRHLCYCDTTDRSLTPHLCLSGCWESWVTQAIARILRPGMRCLDLGANVGYFTLLMADAVGPSGRVTAVEASPRLAELLRRTVEVNGLQDRVSVVQKAAADRSGGRLHLHLPPGLLGNGAATTSAGPDTIEVETVTADDLLKDWEKVDVVKIDIEGSEAAAWRGMARLVARSPGITVIMEFANRRAYDPAELLRDITSAGFTLRYLDTDSAIEDLSVERALHEPDWWMLWLTRQ